MFEMLNEWFLQTLAMMLTAFLLPHLKITSVFGAFTAVVCLGFVNANVWDAALFFSVPNHFSIQTLVLLISNGGIFFILVKFLPGIEVDSVFIAVLAPVIFSVLCLLIQEYGHLIDWGAVWLFVKNALNYLKTFIRQSPQSFIFLD